MRDMDNMIDVRSSMVEWIERELIKRNNFLEFTKKEFYLSLGMHRPTKEFNRAWKYLTTCKAEFLAFDKEKRTWIYL